jgi:hypothetical protein
MINDRHTSFTMEAIQAIGKFRVGEIREDGYLIALYRMECEEIAKQ